MPKSFGERLKKVRIDRGLRQEDIGAIVHMGKSTVSQWENNIHVPDIVFLSKIFHFPQKNKTLQMPIKSALTGFRAKITYTTFG